MKAVKFLGNCRLEVIEKEPPKLRPGWVVLKMRVSPICGSDLHQLYEPPVPPTWTPGHEFMGEVVEAGPESRVGPGQRVAVYTPLPDGNQLGMSVDGGDEEYVLVPHECCIPLQDDISDEVAALAFDPIGVPLRQLSHVGVKPHELVVVSGLGPMGLGAVVVAKYLCCRVIGVDVNPYRVALAKRLGADFALNARSENLQEAIAELSRGQGLDIGMECAARNESLNFLLDNAARNGRICLIGELYHATFEATGHITSRRLTIYGSSGVDRQDFLNTLHILPDLPTAGEIVTHRFPLEQADLAFKTFREGNTGKVVFLGSQ